MGGPGSGRWAEHAKRATVGETLRIDVRHLARQELVSTPGGGRVILRMRAGETVLAVFDVVTEARGSGVGVRLTEDGTVAVVELVHRAGPPDRAGHLSRVWYALCPTCRKRVRALYRPEKGKPLACRVCCGLVYARRPRADDDMDDILDRLRAAGGGFGRQA